MRFFLSLLVVDGQLLVEEEYRREEDEDRPTNFSLLLGCTRAMPERKHLFLVEVFPYSGHTPQALSKGSIQKKTSIKRSG